MNEILCTECGHGIDKHLPAQYERDPGCAVIVDSSAGVYCDCLLTPQDIAAAAVQSARQEALFMANVWKTYAGEFNSIVDDCGGDSYGIAFVVDRILKNAEQEQSAITNQKSEPAPAEQEQEHLCGVNYVISRTWADKHLNSDDDLKYFNGKAEIR